ncbi:hypothetical protein Tco_0930671 [Tanacetum coccineum]
MSILDPSGTMGGSMTRIQWVLGRITNSLPGVGTNRSLHLLPEYLKSTGTLSEEVNNLHRWILGALWWKELMVSFISGRRDFANGEGNYPSNKFVNNEATIIDVAPLNSAPPSHVADNIRESDDVSLEGDIVGEVGRLRKSSKATGKRKLATGPSSKDVRHKLRKVPPQASKVAGDASDSLDVESDPDINGKFYTFSASSFLSSCGYKLIFVFQEFPSAKELKNSVDCHFVVAHVTPPSWKQHLRDISLEKLCDIHDRAYMEIDKDKAYVEIERKCNEALQDLDQNPLVLDMRAEIEMLQGQLKDLNLRERLNNPKTQLLQDIDSLKHDQATVVSKVVPDVATKLIRSDEMGCLITKLVKAAMFRGRRQAFEEVASLKGPFILEKMHGYRSTSKEEFDRAGDVLANASYPFLSEVIVDLHASVEQLLSKNPQSLCSKPALSFSRPLSSKTPVM